MGQLLIGLGATLGMIALSIIGPLLVGVVVLWIVSYIPIVGRRGQTHPRRLREATPPAADATPDPPA
jgi:hypothetical protein